MITLQKKATLSAWKGRGFILRKPKLWELDIVRAVAIAAVLLIHGTAESTVVLPPGSRSHLLYFAINRLSVFAVPVFILLSGLVLFYSYYDQWNVKRIPGFYRKRLQFILIPYLIWLCFYYLFYQWMDPTVSVHFNWLEYLKIIPWADVGYHLYFMVIIMQFYALFPLLVSLAKAWRPLGRYLWLFGIAIQAAFVLYGRYSNVMIEHRASMFITYFSLFCIGGSIGMNYERFIGWLNRNVWWVTAAAAAAGFTFLIFSLQAGRGMQVKFWEYELLFNGYPVLVAISLIWIGRHLLEQAPRVAAALSSLGAASFGIYFMHPALLALYSLYFPVPKQYGVGYHLVVWGSIALIFAVPWAITAALKRVKGSWLLFGK